MDFTEASRIVGSATSYLDVFGACEGVKDKKKWLKDRHAQLQRALHPDLQPVEDQPRATELFAALGKYEAEAAEAIERGTYGAPTAVLTTNVGEHRVGKKLVRGDICDLFDTHSRIGGSASSTVLKLCRTPRDNDLLAAELKALKLLRSDDDMKVFYPEPLDQLLYSENGSRRRGIIIPKLDGWYSLQEVKQRYPRGIPAIHMVWVWRRVLWLLGYAHEQGVIHGAVLPRHLMMLPEHHGIMLIDWCYSVVASDDGITPAIQAIVPDHKPWYPSEVLDKAPPSAATDIYMAAGSMMWLAGGDPVSGTMPASVPRPLRAFLTGCRQRQQSRRPSDAWGLLGEFDTLLERMGSPFFPRTFREFTLPA